MVAEMISQINTILFRSIKNRLMFIGITIGFIGIILTATSFSIYNIYSIKNSIKEEIMLVGKIIGRNISPLIHFNQKKSSFKILQSLEEESSIIQTCVYISSDNSLFSYYKTSDQTYKEFTCPSKSIEPGQKFGNDILLSTQEIFSSNKQPIGFITIYSNLDEINKTLQLYFIGLVVLISTIFIIIIFISSRMQKTISEPIMHLKDTAHSISFGKNYSSRATKIYNDEIGDLTDSFNEMMHKVQEAKDSLEQKVAERTHEITEALAIKERFIDNMNHELRTPLHNIIPAIRRIIKHWNEYSDKEKLHQLGNIRFAGMRLQDLVNDLLDLSKIQSGNYVLCVHKIKLSNLVEYTLRELEPNLKKGGYETQLNILHGEEDIICDAVKISRVIRNLISNAIKYGEGNPITITISNHQDGKSITCQVRDSGLGIPPGEEEHIFGHFVESSRTQKREKGIGLGLSICKEIIELHHGSIHANNNTNAEGSTFTFSIPKEQEIGEFIQWSDSQDKFANPEDDDALIENIIAALPFPDNAKDKDKTAISVANSDTSPSSKHKDSESIDNNIHIVLADDEELNLQALEFSLHAITKNVSTFINGSEAWEFIKVNQDTIDVVILDNMMPGMYGLDILKHMRKKAVLKDIPVIMQTAKKMTDEDYAMVEKNQAQLLKKPFDDEDLVSLTRKVIKDRKKLDDINETNENEGKEKDTSSSSSSHKSSHHIVVADDEELNLDLLSYSLDKISNNISYFKDGTSTWEYIKDNPEKIDVVILDNMMPGMYGVDILEKMRKDPALQSVPVILQTAKSLKPEAIKEIEAQSAVYLKKPFDDKDLIKVINGIIKDKCPSDAKVVIADNNELKILFSKSIPHTIDIETDEPRLLKGLCKAFDQLKEFAPIIIEHLENGDPSNQKLNSELWHKLYNIHHLINLYTKNLEYESDYLTNAKLLIAMLEEARPPKTEV